MQVKSLIRGPSGDNGAAGAVAGTAGPSLRGSTPSNLDSTRTRIVKRGSVVEFPGGHGLTCRVARVRLGYFWPELGGFGARCTPCSVVKVVS